MQPTLFYLCGLPASGKSLRANYIKEEHNAIVHSSDTIRKELFGDEDSQGDNELVFKTMFERTKRDLLDSHNVVFDATNISYKHRKAFLTDLSKVDCKKICVLIATPYEDCLTYNLTRDRQVPEYVITRMYKNFYIPQKYEGWDDIQIVWNYDKSKFDANVLFDGDNGLNSISHDNPNHTYTIGQHCIACATQLLTSQYKSVLLNGELLIAAYLHDIGKRFTKEFKDSKGEPSDIAHYYQHQLVSAYDSLFYTGGFNDTSRLKIANYIQWHMQPFFTDSDKSKEKYRKLWGDQFYDDIMLLHKADLDAH